MVGCKNDKDDGVKREESRPIGCLIATINNILTIFTNTWIYVASIIWSHYHWDHVGNTALFPPTTELVVGPGFKASPNILPGFPDNIDSPVDAKVFAKRTLTEIDFSGTKLQIGGYDAYDFFDDGSFYLLGRSPSFLPPYLLM